MRIPKYRPHSLRDFGFVEWKGERIPLPGKYKSPESLEAYGRFLAEIGRAPDDIQPSTLTVGDLATRYLDHAQVYYRGGKEYQQMGYVWRVLTDTAGNVLVNDFGPRAAERVQQAMVAKGWTRPHINRQMVRLRRMFRWGVSREMVKPSVLEALRSLSPLKRGRTVAPEPEPVGPVPEGAVARTLPHLSPVVQDMVRLQEVTGMRSDNLCRIRPMDVDQTHDTRGNVWIYRPEQHKARWRGAELRVLLGPRAQAILTPYLEDRAMDAFCFSPRESEERRHAAMRAARKTRVQPSQAARKPKKRPKHPRRDHYDSSSYWKAVARGIKTANRNEDKRVADANAKEQTQAAKEHRKPIEIKPDHVPAWHPHQLRHSIATEIRRKYGLEGSQVFLGHADADVTQIYAERDLGLAFKIAAELG